MHTSYTNEQDTFSQGIWSPLSLCFSISLIGENGILESMNDKCLVGGSSDLEQYISRTIHMNGMYIYDNVPLNIWNNYCEKQYIHEDYLRILLEIIIQDNTCRVIYICLKIINNKVIKQKYVCCLIKY